MALVNGCLAVKITLDSRPGWFILDTGSPYSWVSPSFLKTLPSIKPGPKFSYYGVTAPTYDVAVLQAGGAVLFNTRFIDLSFPGPAVKGMVNGEPIVGDLGYNALRMTTLAINFDKCEAYLWGPAFGRNAVSEFLGAAKIDHIALESDQACSWIKCKVNGTSYRSELDLGSIYTNIGTPASWQSSAKEWQPVTWRTNASGAQTLGIANQMSLNGVSFQNVPLSLGLNANFFGWLPHTELHKVVFDLQAGSIYFPKPKASLNMLQGLLYMRGLAVAQDSGLVLRKGASNIQALGSKDVRIESVQGVPIKQTIDNSNAEGSLKDVAGIMGSSVISVTIGPSGKQRTIKLKYLPEFAPKCSLPAEPSKKALAFAKCFAGGPGVYVVTGELWAQKAQPGQLVVPKENTRQTIVAVGVKMPEFVQDPNDPSVYDLEIPDYGANEIPGQ